MKPPGSLVFFFFFLVFQFVFCGDRLSSFTVLKALKVNV